MTNSVVHFEIPADDFERAQKFYTDAFGWQLQHMPELQYTMVMTTESDEQGMPKTPGSINGGMGKRQSPTSEHPTVTQGDLCEQSTGFAIPQRTQHHGDLVSDLDVGELPTGLHQDARAAKLDAPVLDDALVVGHIDLDVSVGIGPLECGDRSGHRHPLRGVEHGERVMRIERANSGDGRAAQHAHVEAGLQTRQAKLRRPHYLPFSFAAFSSARAALRMLASP